MFAQSSHVARRHRRARPRHDSQAVDAALAKLKAQIRQIDTRNYLEARNFLNSLGYEANFASAG